MSKEVIIIEDYDEYSYLTPIGVASNIEKAREMRDEYFGPKMSITKVMDVRDSGIEYIEHYVDSEGDKGRLVYRSFIVDEI